MEEIPEYGSLPVYHLNFMEYGLEDLSPESLYWAWKMTGETKNYNFTNHYLADRVGF